MKQNSRNSKILPVFNMCNSHSHITKQAKALDDGIITMELTNLDLTIYYDGKPSVHSVSDRNVTTDRSQ